MERDVVYIVREGARQDELRYSLRSLVNLPHRNVWLVGHCPGWAINVFHEPTIQMVGGAAKHRNTAINTRAIANLGGYLSQTFYLFHDDNFIMEPMPEVPVYNRGPWLEWEEFCQRDNGSWGARKVAKTREYLEHFGKPLDYSFELHVPMPVDRDLFVEALTLVTELDANSLVKCQKRSFIGNYAGMSGVRKWDVKLKRPDDPLPKGPLVSTSDASFLYFQAGREIRRRFKEPSRYEQEEMSDLEQLRHLRAYGFQAKHKVL